MKRLYSIVAAVSAALAMWSCGPAEMGYTQEFTLQSLYTVNKAAVAPEFSDTFLFVKNLGDFDLKTGDRAMLLMHYYYDAYSGKQPQWNVKEVLKRFPVYPLSAMADVDTAMYRTPITGLQPLNFFNDFDALTWVWKEKQNVCIKYKGIEKDASFAMAVRGVKDGCVELDLFVDARESDTEAVSLLTFDISDIEDYLSDEERTSLNDSIVTKIYLKRMKNGILEDWAIPGNDIRRLR
jgi:hypothetical protein